MTGENGSGNPAAARRRTRVRPRPLPQSAGATSIATSIAKEGDQYSSAANGSPTSAHLGHANMHANNGNASQSPTQTRTRMIGNGYGNKSGHRKSGGSSLSPKSRQYGTDAFTSTSRNNWKRFLLLLSIASFVVVWMSIMTAMVAKLAAGENNPNQQRERITDAMQSPTNGNRQQGGTIRRGQVDVIISSSGSGILSGLASMWRRIRCGRACWGRTYTFTDPIDGRLQVATLDNFANGADGHWPRGPVYYATPSMFPYAAPQLSSSPRRMALQSQWNQQGTLDPMLRVNPGEEAAPQDHDRQPYVQGDCVPMKEWQVSSFPNCNAFHELNMMGMGRNGTDVTFGRGWGSATRTGRRKAMYHMEEDAVNFLGRGWFRAAWKVDFGLEESYPVVLKTLRLEREFYDEYYDLHRKDAVAMERLTVSVEKWILPASVTAHLPFLISLFLVLCLQPSPYVIDIYGFCGQSAINELADFFDDFTNLQAFARQLGGNNDEHLLRLKLQICIMMALGVAHMHEIDGPNNATMVHYDINPKNVAIVKGGKPKLNDFNTVEFLKWNRVKQERCGFRGRLHEPWWRAPEELIMPEAYAEGKNISADAIVASFEDQPLLDEKIDVWSLGNLIYNMLTGHAARGQAKAWRYAEVRRDVLAAKMPWRPTDAMYLNSTQPAIVAMKRAVERCIVKDPKRRWSALDVAYEMMDALDKILEGNEKGSAQGDSNETKAEKKDKKNNEILEENKKGSGGDSNATKTGNRGKNKDGNAHKKHKSLPTRQLY